MPYRPAFTSMLCHECGGAGAGQIWETMIGQVIKACSLGPAIPETLKGDDALSTKPVMHYQGTAYLCY